MYIVAIVVFIIIYLMNVIIHTVHFYLLLFVLFFLKNYFKKLSKTLEDAEDQLIIIKKIFDIFMLGVNMQMNTYWQNVKSY